MKWFQTFTYLFGYKDWLPRAGLGMVMMLIPMVGPIALHGWFVRLMRMRISGDTETLPPLEFGEFGVLLKEGFRPFAVNFIATVPVLMITYAAMGMVFVALGLAVSPKRFHHLS